MNELHYGWPKLSIPEPKQTLNNPTQSKFFCSKFSTFTLRWFTLLLSKDEPSKIRDMQLKKVSPNSKLTNVILVDVCMNCFCNWQLSWLENNSLTISLKLLIRKLILKLIFWYLFDSLPHYSIITIVLNIVEKCFT